MPPLSILMKPASGNCNMLCEYCFYCDEQKNRTQKSYGMMEEKTARNIIRKALAYAEGGCAIAFQGGEPTLRGIDFYYKVAEYVEKYNKKKIPVTYAFQTNGTNINEEWCKLFKNCGFLVGISLDGIWKTHNCYRHAQNGKETFDRILETCKMLKQYDVPFNILTVVHDQTAQYLNEIYSFYSKKGFEYQQYIPCIDPLQQEKGKMHYSLDPVEYGKFLIRLFEKWNEDIRTGRSIYIRQFDNYIGILKGYEPEACDQRGCCGIQYVIEADGSVYPCDFYMMDEYCLGNANTDTFGEMDENRKNIRFQEESLKISQTCKNCRYLKLCRGGCQRNRNKLPDGTWKNYFCEGYRLFFDTCYDKMVEIAQDF